MPSRSRIIIAVFLLVLCLYTIYRFGVVQIEPPGFVPNDFVTFPRACERLGQNEPIYRPEDSSPYKYSPTFLLFFCASLAKVSREAGWLVWCIASIVIYLAALGSVWNKGLASVKGLTPARLAGLLVAFTIFGWHGYIEHFSYGQGDFLVFGAFLWAFLLSLRETPARIAGTGIVLGLILIMKPQAGLLLAYFMLVRQWRILGAAAISTLALLLLPGLFWGFPKLFEMFAAWKYGLSRQSIEFLTGNLNQNLAATLARLSGSREAVTWLIPLFTATAAAMTIAITIGARTLARANDALRVRLVFAVLMLYGVASPLSWRWNTFLWTAAGVIAAADALAARSRTGLVLLGLFAANSLLLQKVIASVLGIPEVDELSFIGLYCLGNGLLLVSITRSALDLQRLSS